MISSTPAGLALTVLAGFMAGNCMLPSKFLRGWGWENMWSIFSVVSLVILPWTLAFLLVDHLGAVYRTVHPLQLIVPVVFGMCWGVAQVLFGISVERLGLGLAYAIIVGMGAALGTLVPLFVAQRNALGRNTPLFVLTGISLMVVGIAFTTWAGRLRERRAQPGDSSHLRTRYRAAVLLAVLCGFLAPMLNYSFAFGQDIAQRSIALGNSPLHAAYAVWPISLMGGFFPNAGYSVYLLIRRRSWRAFTKPLPDSLCSFVMAALWMGAFAVYGMSAAFLGNLGTSIGWGVFQIFMIMTATLSGVLTGEWKSIPGKSKAFLAAGMALLVFATLLLTMANRR
jgi:L-rhamnose-H+ transport protein